MPDRGIVIPARMNSSRLPAKATRLLAGVPLIEHVVNRCERVAGARVVLATSDRASDDVLAEYAHRRGLDCFRGSLEDVTGRFVECCDKYGFTSVARANGDSPFVAPDLITAGFAALERAGLDFVTNLMPRTYPYGVACEVLRVSSLKAKVVNLNSPHEREHVTQVMYSSWQQLRTHNIVAPEDWSHVRMTVDIAEDLVRCETIMRDVPDWDNLSAEDLTRRVLRLIETRKVAGT